MALAFIAPGGVATPFVGNFPFLPQYITYNPGANPITSMRITTNDGTLHDWNAAFIAAINGFCKVGVPTANAVTLKTATGRVPGNITINGVTAAVGAINFYFHDDQAHLPQKGQIAVPYMSTIATVQALTPTVFDNFTALFIPTMATITDYADIEFSNGHQCRWELEDIVDYSSYFQQVAACVISNITGKIHRATLRFAAATPVYVYRAFIKGQK